MAPTPEAHEWSPKSTPVNYGVATLIVAVWFANAALVTASVFMFLNWGAVHWLVGDTEWSIVLAVFCAICLAYSVLVGCCILGFRQHTQRSYLSLRQSPKCRLGTVLIVPLIVLTLFLTLSAMTLSNASTATSYIRAHSNNIYASAYSKPTEEPDKISGVTYDQFLTYMTDLPQFAHLKNDDAYAKRVQHLFDAMSGGKRYLTRDDVFHGMIESLAPLRDDFGYATLGVFLVNLFYFIAYLGSYWQLKSVQLEKQIEALKMQKAVFAAQQAAQQQAAASSQALLDAGADEQARMFDYFDEDYDELLLGDDFGADALGIELAGFGDSAA